MAHTLNLSLAVTGDGDFVWRPLFRGFINAVRNDVEAQDINLLGRHFSKLTIETAPTIDLNLVATDNQHQITIRLRRNDLYMMGFGFQRGNPLRWRWYHFNTVPDTDMPQGSTRMYTGDSYASIEGKMSTETTSRSMKSIALGFYQLDTAIMNLSNPWEGEFIGNAGKEKARSLLMVLEMIVEAIRFRQISDLLETMMQFVVIRDHIIYSLQNEWTNKGKEVLDLEAKQNLNELANGQTIDELHRIIAVVKVM